MTNRPEDFEPIAEKEENEKKEEGAREQPPRWYGIAYESDGNGYMQNAGDRYMPPPVELMQEQRPPKKRRKMAVMALCMALCILLSSVAGFVGGALYERMQLSESQGPAGGNIPTGVGGSSTGGETFDYDSSQRYPYEERSGDFSWGSSEGLSNAAGGETGSAGGKALSKIQATAKAKDAVVEIMTETSSGWGQISAGAGSGVIIHGDGIIVTNHHVIAGADTVYVRLTNGNTYAAAVRGSDEDGDIAVIKIQPREVLTVATLGNSSYLALGEDVFAIGNPLGELGGTVTYGTISALERQVSVDGVTMSLIQTDTAINGGNSGGGLFNMAGELIGIVNAKYAAEGVEGLGFAIPVDAAVTSVNHLLERGYIPGVPALGVEVGVTSASLSGVAVYMPYVTGVNGTSALQTGDLIYSINGQTVAVNYTSGSGAALQLLKQYIRTCEVGDSVTLVIYRNRVKKTVTVTLSEYIPESPSVSVE